MKQKEQAKKMQQVISKALADEEFKRRLVADATAVLKEEGVVIPQSVEVRAVEDTETVIHIVIPSKPTAVELSDDELASVAGGIFVR